MQQHTQAKRDLQLLYVEERRKQQTREYRDHLPYTRRPYRGLRHRRLAGRSILPPWIDRSCEQLRDAFRGKLSQTLNSSFECNHIPKDKLHKAMGVADMWWGADDVNNLRQQAKLGTRLIDEILQPYFARTQAFINTHTGRFRIYETICPYLLYTNSVMSCFTAAVKLYPRPRRVPQRP